MDGSSDQLLAGAAGADDQHVSSLICDDGNLPAQLPAGYALSNHPEGIDLPEGMHLDLAVLGEWWGQPWTLHTQKLKLVAKLEQLAGTYLCLLDRKAVQ